MTIPILDLDSDVKPYLQVPALDTKFDLILQGMQTAAIEMIESLVGDISPQQRIELHDGGHTSIWTRHTPVIAVDNVRESWPTASYDLDYVQIGSGQITTSMFAYSLDEPAVGQITRRTAGNINIPFMRGVNNIQIVYVAGRDPVSDSIKQALRETIRNWFDHAELRASTTSESVFNQESVEYSRSQAVMSGVGIPYGVLGMLRNERKGPIFG